MHQQQTAIALLLLCAFLVLPVGPVAAAERALYACTHPDGRVEYRGIPLEGLHCTKIGFTRSPAPSETVEPESGDSEDADSSEANQEESARSRNCRIARENLEALSAPGAVRMRSPAGDLVRLDDEARERELRRAQRDVEYWCDEP